MKMGEKAGHFGQEGLTVFVLAGERRASYREFPGK